MGLSAHTLSPFLHSLDGCHRDPSASVGNALILDVRDPAEFAAGHVPKVVNLPLSQLRKRHAELTRDREIWTYCGVGQRSYFAARFLMHHGYRVRNLPGGFITFRAFTRPSGAP